MHPALLGSRALWNRNTLRLESDETLAQILDRGEMASWRALYSLARDEIELRKRIARLLDTAPIGMVHFWKAALQSLGEPVDYARRRPPDADWI